MLIEQLMAIIIYWAAYAWNMGNNHRKNGCDNEEKKKTIMSHVKNFELLNVTRPLNANIMYVIIRIWYLHAEKIIRLLLWRNAFGI